MVYQRGVFWGVVPFTPAAPFQVKFIRAFEEVETAADLVQQLRRRDLGGTLEFSVPGKVRPLLAISEPSAELEELTALRLVNISRRVRQRQLTPRDEQDVVAQQHPHLFHLRHEVVAKLTTRSETYAAVVDSPITVHRSAITTGAIGQLNEHEFQVLCERFVEKLGLDITLLVDRRARELVK